MRSILAVLFLSGSLHAQVSFQGLGAVFGTGLDPVALCAADFDLDGDQDLVIADAAADQIVVLTNDGTGTFAIGAVIAVGGAVSDADVGDIDFDGRIDIVVAAPPNLVLLTNMSNNNFAPSSWASAATYLAIGRFDGDAFADAVLLIPPASSFPSLLTLETRFGAATGFGTTAQSTQFVGSQGVAYIGVELTIGDADSDGDLDIAAMCPPFNIPLAMLARNDGFGSFTMTIATNPLIGIGGAAVFADREGDGLSELLVGNYGRGFRFLNSPPSPILNYDFLDGDDGFLAAPAKSIAAADLDGDGDIDVLGTHGSIASTGWLSCALQDGPGDFGPAIGLRTSTAAKYAVTRDFDGDGDVDIAALGPGALEVLRNDTTGTTPTIGHVNAVGGGGQVTAALNPFAAPIVFEWTSPNGAPVQGEAVTLSASNGFLGSAASTAALTLTTDTSGRVATTVTPYAFTTIAVLAIADHAVAASIELASTALGIPGPYILTTFTPPASSVLLGDRVPLVVSLTNAQGVPLPGVAIAFQSTGGALTVNPSTAMRITDAAGIAVGIFETSTSGTSTISASVTGQSAVYVTAPPFLQSVNVITTRAIALVSGMNQIGSINEPYLDPVVVDVTDLAGGVPAAGVDVMIRDAAGVIVAAGITDSSGRAVIPLFAGPVSGNRTWTVSTLGSPSLVFTTYNRRLMALGNGLQLILTFECNTQNTALLITGQTPPQPAAPTSFGNLYTSVFTPTVPGFVYRDGIGLLGPVTPTVANPIFSTIYNAPPALSGSTFVFQAIGYAPTLAFPDCWFLSNAAQKQF